MKVENVSIYDLDDSIIASGYPMRTELINRKVNEKDIKTLEAFLYPSTYYFDEDSKQKDIIKEIMLTLRERRICVRTFFFSKSD